MRREFPVRVRKAAWERSGGRCEECGHTFTLTPKDRPQYDHVIADGLTGDVTLENCACLCAPCHLAKTKSDVKRIAKAKRIEAERIGLTARKQRIGSPYWKRRIDGTTVRRD